MLCLSKHPTLGDLDIWEITPDCHLKLVRTVFRKGSICVFADGIHIALMRRYIVDYGNSVEELTALAALEAL